MKIALLLMVILSLVGLVFLFYVSHKMLRRVRWQEAQEKLQAKQTQRDNASSSQQEKT